MSVLSGWGWFQRIWSAEPAKQTLPNGSASSTSESAQTPVVTPVKESALHEFSRVHSAKLTDPRSRYTPRTFAELDETAMKNLRETAASLPSFPVVTQRIVAELQKPDTSAARIAQVIRTDPVLSADIVRIANSASFAQDHEVTDVLAAINLMGFDVLQSVALHRTLMKSLRRTTSGGFDQNKLWAHSVATSIYAGDIASRTRHIDPGEAVTAGLLHDIGKVVFNVHYPAILDDLLDPKSTHIGESMLAKEERLFGGGHNAFGAVLGQTWNLPEVLTQVIDHHHCENPLKLDFPRRAQDLIAVVLVANQFAKLSNFAGCDTEIDVPTPEVMEILKLPTDIIEAHEKQPASLRQKISAIVG